MGESPDVLRQQIAATKAEIQTKLQTLSQKMSLKQQFKSHPWLVLGASAAAGYLAVRLNRRSPRGAVDAPNHNECEAMKSISPEQSGRADSTPASTISATSIPHTESKSNTAFWGQTKSFAAEALGYVIQRALIQVVPHVVDRLRKERDVGAQDSDRTPEVLECNSTPVKIISEFERC